MIGKFVNGAFVIETVAPYRPDEIKEFQSYIDEKLYYDLLTPEILTKVLRKRGLL